MAYHVITSLMDKAELEKEVGRFQKMGWKPQGGVVYWDGVWAQAMVKEAPDVVINYPARHARFHYPLKSGRKTERE